ncbi:MAG TPA: hypothetical protein VJL59_04460 [Anaerolineales bacterium]|nr:hypothetical protein [Anaerolineales bacterium]
MVWLSRLSRIFPLCFIFIAMVRSNISRANRWGIVWLTKTSWQELGWRRKGLLKSIGLGLLGFVLMYINVIVWAMLKGNTEQPEMFAPSPTW